MPAPGNFANLSANISGNLAPLSGALNKARGMLHRFGASVAGQRVSLRGMATGIAAVVAPLAYAARQAIKLESGFAEVSKVTELKGGDLQEFKSGIQGISQSVAGIRNDELLEMATIAGRIGIAKEGLLDYVRALAMAKVAMPDIPVEELARDAGRILNIFQLNPSEAIGGFLSALNKLDDTSSASGQEILDTANRVSKSLGIMGASPQAVLALSAAMKDVGISNEVAGTAMASTFGMMASDSKKFAETVGMDMESFRKLMGEKPVQAIMLLSKSLGSMGLDALPHLKELGIEGTRSQMALLALSRAEGLLTQHMATANREFATGDSLQKEAAVKAQTTGAQITKMANSIQWAADAVGTLFLPAITQAANQIGLWASQLQLAAQGGSALGGWVGWLSSAIETAGVVIRNWGDIWDLTVLNVSELIATMVQRVEWVWDVVKAFGDWVGSNWVTIFRDSIRAIVQVIANMGTMLINQFKQVRGFLSDPMNFDIDWSAFNPMKAFDMGQTKFETPGFNVPEFKGAPILEKEREAISNRMVENEQKIQDLRNKPQPAKPDLGFKGPTGEGLPGGGAGAAAQAEADKQRAQIQDTMSFAKALGIGGLAKANDPANRTAKASEKTAKSNEQMAKDMATVRDAIVKGQVGIGGGAMVV